MRHHVAPIAMGNQDGQTWQDAIDLQTLFSAAAPFPVQPNDEIWFLGDNNVFPGVGGTYNLTAQLQISISNLSIYGGFEGWENTLCDRRVNISTPPSAAIPNYFLHPSILDGGGLAVSIVNIQNAQNIILDGFLIRNANVTQGIGGGVSVVNSNNIWFERLVVMNNTTISAGGGIGIRQTDNVVIKNAVFFNNHTTAGDSGGGLSLIDCRDANIVNVLFTANSADGDGGGIGVERCDNIKIINNTIADNTVSGGQGTGVHCYNPNPNNNINVEIYNSIFYPDDLYISPFAPGNVIVDFCLLSNNPFPNPGQNLNGFTPNPPITPPVNPNFVNPTLLPMGDYHLALPPLPLSPIDSGKTSYIFPLSLTDLEGRHRFVSIVRPFPDIVDMGAFEVP